MHILTFLFAFLCSIAGATEFVAEFLFLNFFSQFYNYHMRPGMILQLVQGQQQKHKNKARILHQFQKNGTKRLRISLLLCLQS